MPPSQSYWTRHAPRYDASMRILGRPLPRMLALTQSAIFPHSRVLEVAAGTGIVTEALANIAREVIATDYAEGMVAQLEVRIRKAGLQNVRCQQADLTALPFEDASFDAAVASNVLHLVPDLESALASLQRVVRKGGKLILPTFLHAETPVSRLAARAFEITGFPARRRLTVRGLRDAVTHAGLRIAREELIPGIFPIGYIEATTPYAG